MKRFLVSIFLGTLMSLSLLTPLTAQAENGVIQLAAQERFISLDQAVARVRRQIDGEVISAKTRYVNDRPIHYVKVYDRGRVRTIRVDARSGRIM
ncbi:MAG: PepSY domain-containing protein [Gammaproteobacteria bacterium]|nr:PepSY domain-containing protein [Gammaproteobacteria bacterium]MDH3768106.1 PepSY domain-containing protein [Gammaproteobacteria bacterium]